MAQLFPWWLTAQLALWLVLVAVWMRAAAGLWRWGAFGLACFYCGLLVFAVTPDPRERFESWLASPMVDRSLGIVLLAAVVGRLGAREPRTRALSETLVALALGGVFWRLGEPVVAAAMTGLFACHAAFGGLRRDRVGESMAGVEVTEVAPGAPVVTAQPVGVWLCVVIALLWGLSLVGTVRYAAMAEARRVGINRQTTAVPRLAFPQAQRLAEEAVEGTANATDTEPEDTDVAVSEGSARTRWWLTAGAMLGLIAVLRWTRPDGQGQALHPVR